MATDKAASEFVDPTQLEEDSTPRASPSSLTPKAFPTTAQVTPTTAQLLDHKLALETQLQYLLEEKAAIEAEHGGTTLSREEAPSEVRTMVRSPLFPDVDAESNVCLIAFLKNKLVLALHFTPGYSTITRFDKRKAIDSDVARIKGNLDNILTAVNAYSVRIESLKDYIPIYSESHTWSSCNLR